MAELSDLPSYLHDHAKKMPKGLLDRLHPGEANHRLQAGHEMTESAERISNPAIHRHVLPYAKRLRNAMPYLEYTAEHRKLTDLVNQADRLGNADIAQAYRDAIRKLEDDDEQVSGVGESQLARDREHGREVSKASQAAVVKKVVDREMAKAKADFERKQTQLARRTDGVNT